MGVFFDEQSPEAIIKAIGEFEKMSFDPEYIRSKVLKFDREIFKEKMKEIIEREAIKHKNKQ